MGFLFGGGKKSSASPPPPAPAPAPVESKETPADAKKARRGAGPTMLTGGSGLAGSPQASGKSLLGQ